MALVQSDWIQLIPPSVKVVSMKFLGITKLVYINENGGFDISKNNGTTDMLRNVL